MIEKNEIYITDIESYGCNGEGIAHIDGFPVFIENALKGEKVKILAVKVLKNFGYGKLLEVLEPSDARRDVICPVFKRCGGCQLLHMEYQEQLLLKTQIVEDCMRKFSGLSDFQVAPCEGAESPFNYRNKAQYPVKGREVGFYAQRSHDLIPVEKCLMQNEADEKYIEIVKNYAHSEDIRHLYTRTGDGEQMVVLVSACRKLRDEAWLVEKFKEAGATTLVQNINTKNTNVILGGENKVLYGTGKIEGRIGSLKFSVSPHSFFQINTKQTEKLYGKGKELLELKGTERLMDLYCGIGSIGLFMADKVKSVIGVECIPQAIENAKENAKKNGISNAEFMVGLSEEVFPMLMKKGEMPDIVVVDPPRKGCDEKLLTTLLEYTPEKILYISCNPSTLARDLKILSEKYDVGTVYPYDLFPNTRHVECCVRLWRKTDRRGC